MAEENTRNDSERNGNLLAVLKRSIEANSSTSMTTLANKRNVSLSTMSRAVNGNCDITNYVRRCRYFLRAKAKTIRTEKCPKILSFIEYQGARKFLVFVDEKFAVDSEVRRRNFQVIAYSTSDIPSLRQRILPL